MNGEVLKRKETIAMKKMKTKMLDSPNPNTERGDEEDDMMQTLPLPKNKSMKKENSNLNLLQHNLSARGEDEFEEVRFYKQVECQYLISVLKHKSVQVKEV